MCHVIESKIWGRTNLGEGTNLLNLMERTRLYGGEMLGQNYNEVKPS